MEAIALGPKGSGEFSVCKVISALGANADSLYDLLMSCCS